MKLWALETKRRAAPAGGRQRSFPGWPVCVVSPQGQLKDAGLCPLKSFLLGAVHNHPTIRLGELCREEKTNYIKGRDSHSVNTLQGRHPKPTHSVSSTSEESMGILRRWKSLEFS